MRRRRIEEVKLIRGTMSYLPTYRTSHIVNRGLKDYADSICLKSLHLHDTLSYLVGLGAFIYLSGFIANL